MTELPRRRGRPRVHPPWVDPETGESRALRDAPNYPVCKNFQRNALDPVGDEHPYAGRHGEPGHFQLAQRWKDDIAAFTYELTEEIGIRPHRYDLIWPRDPRRPVGPGNVMWLRRPRNVREERRRQIVSLEAQEAIADLLSEADIHELPDGSHLLGSVARRIRHMPSCESAWLEPIECPCAELVRDYFSSY
ncbi:hypothetical protein GUY44_26905 [Pimelobacter simplex]|uniref:hypothetical protein n=1 Tax=Nocardioides simplex TaxID=2045 RepID=UPI0011423F11|nr:hypothetical protein [Pimelobacter simplex]MCG8154132.1 hypothetical protein [Pimelobacter simplex]